MEHGKPVSLREFNLTRIITALYEQWEADGKPKREGVNDGKRTSSVQRS